MLWSRRRPLRDRPVSSDPVLDFKTTRIEALSDGVFAIAMTILVLNISVPTPETASVDHLADALSRADRLAHQQRGAAPPMAAGRFEGRGRSGSIPERRRTSKVVSFYLTSELNELLKAQRKAAVRIQRRKGMIVQHVFFHDVPTKSGDVGLWSGHAIAPSGFYHAWCRARISAG